MSEPTLSGDIRKKSRITALEDRVDSHRQTLAKQAGNAMDLEQRVAELEKREAICPPGLELEERVASLEVWKDQLWGHAQALRHDIDSLEARCEELLVWAWGKSPDTENRLPRGPHD